MSCVIHMRYMRDQETYINDMCTSVSRGPVKAADIPASTNEAYELSKFLEEAAYE